MSRSWHGAALAGWIGLALCVGGASARAAGTLYFSELYNPTFDDGNLRRSTTSGGAAPILASPGGGLRGVAVDAVHSKLYWTDRDVDAIYRANLDGSAAVAIVTLADILLVTPQAIRVDPLGETIYWGELSGSIYRADLDGSNPAPLITTSFAGGLDLDLDHGKVYWTSNDGAGSTRVIRRANLDGSVVETLVTGREASDLAVDAAGGKLYWTDFVNDIVARSNLNGSGFESLYEVGANDNPGGIALDLEDGKVYWGQDISGPSPYLGKIMRMNLDGSEQENVLSGSAIGSVVDIALVVPEPGATLAGFAALAALAARSRRKRRRASGARVALAARPVAQPSGSGARKAAMATAPPPSPSAISWKDQNRCESLGSSTVAL